MAEGSSDLMEMRKTLESLRQELARVEDRLAALETARAAARDGQPAKAAGPPAAAAPEELSEELVAVISAAVAAFLGKKPHIRQIRLLGGAAWAQQGRATIQASHALRHS